MPEMLPVVVIGGGPIGLAAAAHAIARDLPVKLFEAAATVGASLRNWGHVRVFTPWELNVDAAARGLLERHAWTMPPLGELPTGAELYARYLQPLAGTPELAEVIELGARVEAISRHGTDKMTSRGRQTKPFQLRIVQAGGQRREVLARAIIDASGTWTSPNPIGADGLVVPGEREHAERIVHGMPDVLGRERGAYSGRRTLVIGSGYSAANVLIDLVRLAQEVPRTSVIWVVRGTDLGRLYGGGVADQLPARGELGWHLKALVDRNAIALVSGFAATAVSSARDGLILAGETIDGPRRLGPVDRIVVATGQRPDLEMTRELRLELDPAVECVRALAPLIDPNLHSCGDVPPHGHRELAHPEPGFYTIGVKSYGRAPTFLLLTGFEQARSVVAAIAGDMAAADRVQLELPKTGVCKVQFAPEELPSGACCVRSVAAASDACCATDGEARKTAGVSGGGEIAA